MKLISPRHVERIVEYQRVFDDPDLPGHGWAFPCDSEGHVDDDLNEAARINFQRCLTGSAIDRGVLDLSRNFTVDALYRCECGGDASFLRHCAAVVCDRCGRHDGLARCYCGWSASGGDGRRELVELGENLDD